MGTQPTGPVCVRSPVEIVEEGEDEEGQLAPGLLQAELERVAVHHGRRVVEQLLGVRWGVEVPTAGGAKTTARVVDPFAKAEARRSGWRVGWVGAR